MRMFAACLALLLTAAAEPPTQALTIALADDIDSLDPTIARTYSSRIVFQGLCDKLFDIDESLAIAPQLALSYEQPTPTSLVLHLRPNVRFHDGTPLDAAAVGASLMRHLTLSGSTRRAEISALAATEVIDSLTLRLTLKSPSAPFLSQLTDRAGMVMEPRAAAAAEFAAHPVCAGPFRFTERVAQDRIVLDRFDGYWDAARIHFARVTYRPITNDAVRFTNLQAGAVTFVERLAATDVARARADPHLAVQVYDGLGYGSITLNVANGPAARTPFGQNPLVRRAFEAAIDREALIQVVYNGMFTPVAQGISRRSPFYNADLKPRPRDLVRARALLAEAGVALPVAVTLTMVNSPDQLQVGEVIQAMTAEAGFAVKVQAQEFATALQAETRGDFQATAIGWSGRVDPDGNLYNGLHSNGPLNAAHYANPEVDAWLDQARLTADLATRRALYARVTTQVAADLPVLYLYGTAMVMGMDRRLAGFRPVPDGLVRLQDLVLNK